MSDVLVVIGIGGMGVAIARRLGPGRPVLLADFDDTALHAAADRLRGDGYDVYTQQVDVSDAEAVAALAARAAELGPVTSLAHTAGLSPTQASAAAILGVDLAGVAHVLDEFGKIIAPGGAGVVIASMAGSLTAGALPAEMETALARTPTAELLDLPFLQEDAVPDAGVAYAFAKRGNQLRVQTASLAWGARGARVNSISPGVISTPMGRQELAGDSGANMRAMIAGSGTGRVGTPADIAAAVAFLLGPEASFITGTDLLVDGGVVAAVRSGSVQLGG
ncbi:MAG TPA: SDR family oxidoreductase [Nocardia sp.]|uniref:SDR family oxidoreductase n=1 Tax=Nocardia sp. TaxID=1821 RepID=UPI002B4B30FC|nr:SDR family oxidoreductase [Nocardia sp.]HLS77091.1 SDR family oxidoreductase [Nocardia sp.]